MEAYPAGNFVALATYSVVTQDDTSTWVGAEEGDGGEVEEVEGEAEGDGQVVHGISVVEITETGPDGSSTTTTATSTTTTIGGETVEHVDIVRARTPDILEGTDDEDDGSPSSAKRSTGLNIPHAHHGHEHEHGQDSKSAGGGGDAAASSATSASAERVGREDEEEEDTTVLFQWEEPVGYLFSHPYSRESVTLHRMGAHTATAAEEKEKGEASSKPKRIRLEGGGTAADKDPQDDDEEESEGDTKYDHDQLMEKYYIHDCAIHPSWRGQGLASKLWKALEESLTPNRDVHGGEGASGAGEGASGDLVDTEEEEEGSEGHSEGASSDDNTASRETSTTRRRRGGRRGSKKTRSHGRGHSGHGHRHRRRKGAPNLKEIVLVSVQGTKPFWQRAGGFQVVADHDMDLSVYGAEGEAFLMRKTFIF